MLTWLSRYLQRFLGMHRDLQIYCLAMLFNRFGSELLGGGLFQFYLRELGIEILELGALSSLYAVFRFFLRPVAGGLSDKVGRKKLILLNSFGSLLVPVVAFLALHWTWLLPAWILSNLLEIITRPAYQAFIGDVTEAESRQTAMATLNTLTAVPGLIAPPLGGLLAQQWGIRPLFLGQFSCNLMGVVILFSFLKETVPSKSIGKERVTRGVIKGIRDYFSSIRSELSLIPQEGRRNLTLIIIMGNLRDIERGVQSYLWIHYRETLKTPYPVLGLLSSVGVICYMVSQIPLGKLSDKYGRKPLIVSGILLYGSAILAIPHVSNYYWLIPIEAVRTIGGPAHGQSVMALMYDIIPSQVRGSLFGIIFGPVRSSTQIAGPLIDGYMWTQYGSLTTIYFVSAICYVIGVTGFFLKKGEGEEAVEDLIK